MPHHSPAPPPTKTLVHPHTPPQPTQPHLPHAPAKIKPSTAQPKKDRRETTIKSAFVGFASLVNNLLSNQKKVQVSAPYDPVHLTHIGFNTNMGDFTGLQE
ncbi:uncharacterized protein VP01_2927g2 [Puccinia sorghi]|uniref:CRIB domain-containing protein n=1 Tax=Puccinia sorghi TaxID=27349 RepID=A0A0L6V135_9BASI|nr:uncharacterized protein VP01_2944g2 [Puccinia sorghi]KNZ54521.1 uncharacterized protein VP01_2927g2 [Puccinia sorghi]